MSRVLLVLSLLASSLQAQTVSYFRSKTTASSIVAGSDGKLWFPQGNSLGNMTTLGEVTLVATPHPPTGALATGADGAIWFARLGGIDAGPRRDGTFASYDTGVDPFLLTLGADGNIWFAYAHGIGRMTPTGATTLFPVSPATTVDYEAILDLTVGPDGNIWFADYLSCGLRTITPTGQVTCIAGYLGALRVTSAQGALWITSLNSNKVTQVSTAGTTIATYEGPYLPSNVAGSPAPGRPSYPLSLTAGPDGRIWFATENPVIGNITPSTGALKAIDIPPAVYGGDDITAGPDGNIWVAIAPIPYFCTLGCPPPDPTLPIAFARINLVNPTPRITAADRRNPARLTFTGLGFVPDSVIRWNGVDRATVYLSPFEVALSAEDSAAAGARGGTFAIHNPAPGGGDSAPYVLGTPRHRSTR